MEKSYYKSPIGVLELICENDYLISLKLVENESKSDNETNLIKTIKIQLDEYFEGKRKKFNIKLNPKGSEFQKRVWMELLKIPYGKTKSYSEIATNISNQKAQRAVGSACNKNPIMIIIPCHRVISKNGKLGGFVYGNSIKYKLLEVEHLTEGNFPLFV
ncbi:MAG TPA: cysteine methyltransferase [Cyanobacteria bacterium UBA10660]|nr:MAG TPA: cysteine methyltransferase [Candidatus Gastranaerophilales bacterium HUM_1]HAS94332.1 cysteine methyltransferase [Cyanobacteria bacterium UBA10660]